MRQTHRPDYPLSTSTRLHAPSTILPAISFASGKPSSAKPEAALKRLPHRTFWNQTIEKHPGALGGSDSPTRGKLLEMAVALGVARYPESYENLGPLLFSAPLISATDNSISYRTGLNSTIS